MTAPERQGGGTRRQREATVTVDAGLPGWEVGSPPQPRRGPYQVPACEQFSSEHSDDSVALNQANGFSLNMKINKVKARAWPPGEEIGGAATREMVGCRLRIIPPPHREAASRPC